MEKGTNSQASSGPSYEVFLSFRGTDTRYGFTDCLYHALVEAGINVFRDNESLHVGKEIGGELLQAIENSKIYIPIFSENYASSRWCLRELAYMVECTLKSNGNKEILPIFLNVEPADVKLKTNLYRQTLLKRQKTLCPEVESWEKALMEVGKIKGWNWKKDEGQGDLIYSVIRTVSVKLKVTYENVTKHLVGVEDRVEAIIKMLDLESDSVRFLGIHGIGGVGKTTLAKVVFNTLSSRFHQCCFLADVRESSKGNDGLVNLQKQMLSKLLGSHSANQINNVNDGINMMDRRGVLRNKKVLTVLDDVDEKEQLASLVDKGNWFGPGSRIIITTRDRSVLMIEGEVTGEGLVKESTNVSTYDIQEMEFDHALKLFSRHAFRKDSPPNHRVSLSEKIVHTLGKLPLALEIIGSFLNGKPDTLWVDTLKKLKEAPPMGVQRKLMITYERLEHAQKQVFLDIACFFVKHDKTYPFYMWDACGYHPHDAIEVLLLMSLIKIKDDNTFWMHDQVRDLGREIVRQENFKDPCERSRVWNHEDALSILKQKKGSKNIETLALGYRGFDLYRGFDGHNLQCDAFANLQNLRCFAVGAASLVGDFNNLFYNLRWLSWQHHRLEFEATNFHPTNLVVLELSSEDISEEWIGWTQIRVASKLKVLDLGYCCNLKRTPNLSSWVCLERLNLRGCLQLIEIDKSIGELKLLTALNLEGCTSLRELPKEIGCLGALTEIVMPGSMYKLLYSIGELMKLRWLNLSFHSEMKELPDSIGKLQSLVKLNLSDCSAMKGLPDSIGNLKSLIELNLSDCSAMKGLPDSIGNLQSLIELDLSHCSAMKGLPDSIGKLQSLIELDLSHCSAMKGLPDSIGKLQSLVKLNLSWASINHLPDSIGNLTQLKELTMRGTRGIKRLPNAIGLMEKLEELDAQESDLTGEISEEVFERLSYLRILNLSYTSISELPTTMSRLYNLHTLSLESCLKLKGLPELPQSVTSLICSQHCLDGSNGSRIEIVDAQSVTPLPPSIGAQSQLETLALSGKVVQFLPPLPPSLRELQLEFVAFTRSPDFSKLKNLSTMTFYYCSMLELSGIFDAETEYLRMLVCKFRETDAPVQLEMERLRSLIMLWCWLPFKVLDFSCMKNLETVNLYGCHSLVEIRGLEELGSLRILTVMFCSSLEWMLGLSELKKLRRLEVKHCPKLRGGESLNHLDDTLWWRNIVDAGDFGD